VNVTAPARISAPLLDVQGCCKSSQARRGTSSSCSGNKNVKYHTAAGGDRGYYGSDQVTGNRTRCCAQRRRASRSPPRAP